MIIMTYDPMNGVAVPDGNVWSVVDFLIWSLRNAKYSIEGISVAKDFSTENVFNAMRVAVKQNKISCNEVEFRYKDETITIDKDGLIYKPKGFLDCSHNMLEQLIGENF